MADSTSKSRAWKAACAQLAAEDYSFSEELAQVYVGVLSVDMLLELGEDVADTASTVEQSVRELIGDEVGRLGMSRFRVAAVSDGRELGIHISVEPCEFSDEDFSELVTALTEGLTQCLG